MRVPSSERRGAWSTRDCLPRGQRARARQPRVRAAFERGYTRATRTNDEDLPTLAELADRFELRELEKLARMVTALWPNAEVFG